MSRKKMIGTLPAYGGAGKSAPSLRIRMDQSKGRSPFPSDPSDRVTRVSGWPTRVPINFTWHL